MLEFIIKWLKSLHPLPHQITFIITLICMFYVVKFVMITLCFDKNLKSTCFKCTCSSSTFYQVFFFFFWIINNFINKRIKNNI